MMVKFLILFITVLSSVFAKSIDKTDNEVLISNNYHEDIGIPEAARIKKVEDEALFGISRIVGGSAARLGQFPYQAGLLVALTNGLTSVCGASIVTNNRLLTAAHCWRDSQNQARYFTVILGSIYLFHGGNRIVTTTVILHQHYDSQIFNNDIAVIYVDRIQFSLTIQPIALPRGSILSNTLAGNWVTASGFGRTSDFLGIASNQYLSYVNLEVLSNSRCEEWYGNEIVIPSTLCTSGAGGRGTCGGDSGGPVTFNVHGQEILVGIVSYGSIFGCEIGFPAGHARVSSFMNWIQLHL